MFLSEPLRVQTGRATPWVEWSGEWGEDIADKLIYFKDGRGSGEPAWLVEALRADGSVARAFDGWNRVLAAEFTESWYGYIDGDTTPVECAADRETYDGLLVDRARECVFALV